jgi:hypothetical protein
MGLRQFLVAFLDVSSRKHCRQNILRVPHGEDMYCLAMQPLEAREWVFEKGDGAMQQLSGPCTLLVSCVTHKSHHYTALRTA